MLLTPDRDDFQLDRSDLQSESDLSDFQSEPIKQGKINLTFEKE